MGANWRAHFSRAFGGQGFIPPPLDAPLASGGILSEDLWNVGDSLMANRKFAIEEELKPLRVDSSTPAFLA